MNARTEHPRTLTQYLIEQRRRHPAATGEFNALVLDVAQACKAIARSAAQGSLGFTLGTAQPVGTQPPSHPCADTPLSALDSLANDIFVRTTEWTGTLAGMASDCMSEQRLIPSEYPRGKYLLLFDPLDGAGDTDVNVSVGSIFSILRMPPTVGEVVRAAAGAPGRTERMPSERDFLQRGIEQVAAGYAIYGPATMFVLTVGQGVVGFTLDPLLGEFLMTHPDLRVPSETDEFAIDASNSRFWGPPVKRYVEECLAGRTGPRGKDFRMRWVATLVAETHRILLRGGVFLSPSDSSDSIQVSGVGVSRPRLLFEANPIAMIIEQAGGRASTGEGQVLQLTPESLHQRCGFVFGSSAEVDRIERYHAEHHTMSVENTYGSYYGVSEPDEALATLEERYEDLPLFNARGLFRDDD